MFDSILIATDGSSYTKSILDLAKSFCGFYTDVHLIYVGDITFSIDDIYNQIDEKIFFDDDKQKAAYLFIKESLDYLKLANIKATVHLVMGDPAMQIINYSKQIKATLIVMGHRQLPSISRLFDHSVCIKVIENAHCPVLIDKC